MKIKFFLFLALCLASLYAEEVPQKETPQEMPAEQPTQEFSETAHSVQSAFVRTVVTLLALLLLVVLTIWMFRKMSHARLTQMNGFKSIKILEKRPLSPKSILYLLEVDGKKILIAESQIEVRRLLDV